MSHGAPLVAGGANFPRAMPWDGGKKVWTGRIWLLEKADGQWRDAGKLPRPPACGVSVTHGDSVVCVGGSDAERPHAEAFRLVWKDGTLMGISEAFYIPAALVSVVLVLLIRPRDTGSPLSK